MQSTFHYKRHGLFKSYDFEQEMFPLNYMLKFFWNEILNQDYSHLFKWFLVGNIHSIKLF